MNMMIVEDSDVVRAVLRDLLAQVNGVKVTGEFISAASAIAACRCDPPDAMLLDIQLNSGNGMDVLNVVHSNYPAMKVFVVTNHTDDVYRVRYLRAGAYGFFDKSRELGILRTHLQKLSANAHSAHLSPSG